MRLLSAVGLLWAFSAWAAGGDGCPGRTAGEAKPKVRPYQVCFSTNIRHLKEARFDREEYPAFNIRQGEMTDWLWIDDEFTTQLAMKRKIEKIRPKRVVVSIPEDGKTLKASRELLETVVSHLTKHYPEHYRLEGRTLHCVTTHESWNLDDPTVDPLLLSGRLVQEDLTLVRIREDGEPVLVAGAVFFPYNWNLDDFVGRSILQVHEAVPGYAEKMNARVNQLLSNLRPHILVIRNNWFIDVDPTLSQPEDRRSTYPFQTVTRANIGDTVFVRSERETLRRLPESGYVVFSIREQVYPLSTIKQHPEVAEALMSGMRKFAPMREEPDEKWIRDYLTASPK